jgi:hypothetical protein
MIVRLDGDLAGEFLTRLTIDQVALGNSREARILRAINRVPFKFNISIRGPFRALIATAKSWNDPRVLIRDVLPAPLDRPDIVTEVRRREEDKEQTQTPVEQKVTPTPTPQPSETK